MITRKSINIILIGMMGSGKSTVGKILAEKTDLKYVDIDQLIEEHSRRSIREIFASEGEARFRVLESDVVQDVTKNSGQIISTGGGVVLKDNNINLLKSSGMIFHLHAASKVLKERIESDTGVRPLLLADDPEVKLRKLWKSRLPLYQKTADFEINTEKYNPVEIADEIIKIVR